MRRASSRTDSIGETTEPMLVSSPRLLLAADRLPTDPAGVRPSGRPASRAPSARLVGPPLAGRPPVAKARAVRPRYRERPAEVFVVGVKPRAQIDALASTETTVHTSEIIAVEPDPSSTWATWSEGPSGDVLVIERGNIEIRAEDLSAPAALRREVSMPAHAVTATDHSASAPSIIVREERKITPTLLFLLAAGLVVLGYLASVQ